MLSGTDVTQNLAASPFAAATPPVGQPQDFKKLLKAERDHLELAEGMHKWIGDDVETRILKRYGRL
jgi:ER membrane protein complex subunit 3